MAKIGLTGRTACGKSTIASVLALNGFEIIDADTIAHNLHNRPDVAAGIRAAFGEQVFEGGFVSRQKLGPLVFADPKAMEELQKIMRPRILATIFDRLQNDRNQVVDSFSIIGTEVADWVDEIWVVDCDEETQKKRLVGRQPSLSQKNVEDRIGAQMSRKDYLAGADVIIDNNKSKERTIQAVEWEIRRIIYG